MSLIKISKFKTNFQITLDHFLSSKIDQTLNDEEWIQHVVCLGLGVERPDDLVRVLSWMISLETLHIVHRHKLEILR